MLLSFSCLFVCFCLHCIKSKENTFWFKLEKTTTCTFTKFKSNTQSLLFQLEEDMIYLSLKQNPISHSKLNSLRTWLFPCVWDTGERWIRDPRCHDQGDSNTSLIPTAPHRSCVGIHSDKQPIGRRETGNKVTGVWTIGRPMGRPTVVRE